MADLKRGDNINVVLPSPDDGTLARLRKSEMAELCFQLPLSDGGNIGLCGLLGLSAYRGTQTHSRYFSITGLHQIICSNRLS